LAVADVELGVIVDSCSPCVILRKPGVVSRGKGKSKQGVKIGKEKLERKRGALGD